MASSTAAAMPIRFSNTHYYRIAGRYIFSGDLFIVRGAIYFFPEADLSEQRNEAAEAMPHDVGLAVASIIYLAQKVSLFASGTHDLSRDGISEEEFRKTADARINELKWARTWKNFAETLPLPTRINQGEISNMRLSLTGRLSLSAQSDNHDFNVGPRRRRRLRDTLWITGLGRV
jgi:hypothetical protein